MNKAQFSRGLDAPFWRKVALSAVIIVLLFGSTLAGNLARQVQADENENAQTEETAPAVESVEEPVLVLMRRYRAPRSSLRTST
jgi:hypothetical protein